MAVKHYKDAIELPLDAAKQAEVEAGTAKLRQTMADYGFSKEAAESFQFAWRQYSLTIGRDEAFSGAFHTYADGKPFYELTVTAPGSLFDLTHHGMPPTQLPPEQQRALLAFEISMNLISRVEEAAAYLFGGAKDDRAGGVSSAVGPIDFSTSTRREPAQFFGALDALLDMRLGMLTPKIAQPEAAPAAKPARAPKPPGM